ncbi:hypothetical protein MC885_010961 [Smutsia gigantea]|nr:hypothetical protein MC885_010961 [Smutsia gigantea]
MPPPSGQALNELLVRKEEEWRALQAHRSQLQEAALQDVHSRLEEAQGELRHLREDFVYNLQVLEERDRELERYDAAFGLVRGQEEAQQAEVSELKIENGEADRQRGQYEAVRRKLERVLQELDGDLTLQRQELLLEFESEMQKREHEFRLQADSMSSVVLAHELRVKLLNKELMALEEAGAKAAESLQRAETVNLELEQKLQHQAWEVRDLAAVKDARIKDLECKLHSVQLAWKKEEETFRRKHEELDRMARERDAVLAAVKGAHVEQLQALEARALELQAQCETLELQLRRTQWRQGGALKEKDAVIYKLQEDTSALKSSWDAQIAQLSKEMVSKDLQQLSLAVEREQTLEREKVQLGLDWQRRCDSIEQSHCQQSEDLIQGLITAKEQVAAKLQKTEQMLCDQEVVLKALTLERDQAVQALRTRELFPEKEVQKLLRHQEDISERFPSSEVQRLQEQNTNLRDTIAQMRKEMETLSNQLLPSALLGGETADTNQPDSKVAADAAIPDYVLVLEAEILNLKDKFKSLEEQLEDVSGSPKRSSPHTDPQPRFPPAIEAAGGAAPEDCMSTGSALRRLGDRVHLLSFLVARLRQQVRQEALEVDTIRRELPHLVDQVHLEALELQKQVAELEKHLGTAREEGRGASSRLQLGGPDPMALRRQDPTGEGRVETRDQEAQAPEAVSVHRLQRKLKEAARKVLHLGLEKEQLLEMGNRLRAERGCPIGKPPCHPLPSREAQDPGEVPEAPLGQSQSHFTAQRECFSGCPGKIQPQSAKTVHRDARTVGAAAGLGQRRHKVSTITHKPTCQKENRSPEPRLARELQGENSRHTQESSSPAGSSLQDTWKLLDLGSSPSGLTPQDDSAPERTASLPHPEGSPSETQAAFAIQGKKVEAQAKTKPARPSRTRPAKPKGCQLSPKVRNYNFKD